jgi:hypothetical protein
LKDPGAGGRAGITEAKTEVDRAPVVDAGGPVKEPCEVTFIRGTTDGVMDSAVENVVVGVYSLGIA